MGSTDSGRLADTRDLVVISTRANFDRLERHLHRGEAEALADQIDEIIDRLQDENFADSFKGVFQQETLPDDAIEELIAFLTQQRSQLP